MTFTGGCTKRPCYLRQGATVRTLVQLPTGKALTVGTAADVAGHLDDAQRLALWAAVLTDPRHAG
ncbi:hypothetical protein GCM10023237_01300 [Streptomyces coeruleoprunus]